MSITTEQATAELFRLANRTPFNIALERADSLATDIFGSGKWSIQPSRTEANFYAIPANATLYLSHAGLASLWCLSYVAFHIMDVASRRQRAEKGSSQSHFDIGEELASRRLTNYLAYARQLFHGDRNWPEDLSTPNGQAPLDTVEGRINNTFFGALSWIMLHEIAHVHHTDEVLIPAAQRIAQEYRADNFATQWILDSAGTGMKREFRVLVVSVALAWLLLNEQELGKGTTHPAAILRFREATHLFRMGERSAGLENAAYMLKAIFDPTTTPPAHETPEDLFAWVSQRLEELFPA